MRSACRGSRAETGIFYRALYGEPAIGISCASGTVLLREVGPILPVLAGNHSRLAPCSRQVRPGHHPRLSTAALRRTTDLPNARMFDNDDSRSSAITMLMWINTTFRRRRRQVLLVLALIAAGTVAMTAHSVVMSTSMGGHMSDAAVAVCITVGGGLAAAAAILFAAQKPRWPTWPLFSSSAPPRAVARGVSGHLARAGPPPLLQVFRL